MQKLYSCVIAGILLKENQVSELAVSNVGHIRKSSHGDMASVLCIPRTAGLPGCGHRLHSRGVGMPGPQSAGLVQGGDVRELQEPGLLGWTQLPSRIAYLPYEVLVPSFLEWLLKLSASHSGFRSLLSRGKSVSLSLERTASWWFAMLVSFFFPDVLCLFHSRWVVILYILWY